MEKEYRKLKIGLFTDTYTPQINGVVSSIKIFKTELERQGHEVFIYAPKIKREIQDQEEAAYEPNVIRFESFKLAFQPEYNICLPFSIGFVKNFFRDKLDIVHAQTPFSLGLLAFYYAFTKRKPLVHTYHTLYPEYAKAYIFKGRLMPMRLIEKITAAFCNRCELNIAPSIKIKKLMTKYGVKTPIEVLPTGININDFKKVSSDFRQRFKIKDSAKVLIFVGRFGSEKNIEFLIRSMKIIAEKDADAVLVLVGGGPQEKKLRVLTKKLKLIDKVIFTGYLNKAEVIQAYSASDLFVFASKTETQGMVILEAAACGLPIVAVKDEAFSNILLNGKNGYFTEEKEADFAGAVLKILKNKAGYNRMSDKSIEISKDFTIEKMTNKLLNLYYNLIVK